MFCSVIFTTYNQATWLAHCLRGFAQQTYRDFEVIVADDGSGPETAEVIAGARAWFPVPLRHLWQADDGFRKCHALNKAIQAARGVYCIFTDGDCIPHPEFIATHVALARPGRFLSGGYCKLTMPVSQALVAEDIRSGRVFQVPFLKGLGQNRDLWKLRVVGTPWARLCDGVSTTRASWNGHNASTWKELIVAANGFDLRMRYGGQDREFGERLENAGVRGLRMRHRAVCLHLEHKRGYATPESIAFNRELRAHTRHARVQRAPQGLAETPAEPTDRCQDA